MRHSIYQEHLSAMAAKRSTAFSGTIDWLCKHGKAVGARKSFRRKLSLFCFSNNCIPNLCLGTTQSERSERKDLTWRGRRVDIVNEAN